MPRTDIPNNDLTWVGKCITGAINEVEAAIFRWDNDYPDLAQNRLCEARVWLQRAIQGRNSRTSQIYAKLCGCIE